MIDFPIKNRFTGAAKFTAQIGCTEDESFSVKVGLAVKQAIENKANLRGADLSDANLLVLKLHPWDVFIQREHIRIGCQYHTAEKWFAFDDEKIASMRSEALAWWKRYKEPIKALHKTLEGKS